MTKQRGVTIVSLVVTIILLIILAGISISAIWGENGIITIAKQAKENVELAQIEEQTKLNELYTQMEAEDGTSGGISYDAIAKLQEFKKLIAEAITDKGIDTKETDTAETMAENIRKIEGKVIEVASYDNPYIPEGFIHKEGTWNNGYVIREISTGNEFVWVPCVLDQAKVKEGDKVETFKRTLPSTTATTDPYYQYNKNNLTITGEEGSSASEIETSVALYGGFYIARYEAGIEGTTDNNSLSTKIPTTTKPLSQAGKGVWNTISRADAITVSKNMIDTATTGVKSTLISGAAWDTTLQWMVNSSDNAANEPNAGYDIDSTGNGWHNDVSSSKVTTTGKYPVNNIYDMAGNVWEWTTENCTNGGNSYLVIRGGYFYNSGSARPAADRNYDLAYANNFLGFRVLLYK